jgi:hypothetical protein
MMAAMGIELPKLFKKWSRHLQTYLEIPYLPHFILAKRNGYPLDLPTDILAACNKASPFELRR